MSNETIVARLRDLCIKFADEKASLEELQEGITAHGRALEGMDNGWNQLMDDMMPPSKCSSIWACRRIIIRSA